MGRLHWKLFLNCKLFLPVTLPGLSPDISKIIA